jgi:signal transduction histidine kinase
MLFFSCSPNKTTKEKEITNPYYDLAFEFREKKISDSAFIYFNKAKGLFLKQKDSLGVGKCLVNMAITSIDKGDYFGGLEISLEASNYFNKNAKKHFIYLESNFHELGVASSYLKNYLQAIDFYNKSIQYAQDSASVMVTKNSIANAYGKIGDYNKSFAIFKSILHQKMSDENFARTLSNYAYNKWKKDGHYDAKPELLKALNIRLKKNDNWGLNASYAHLADYYTLKQPDTALSYANKMYMVAKVVESPDDQLQALLKIIKLSPARNIKQFFATYQNLNDSLQTARSAAKNQFALIRYDTEKSKADNLVLQKDNDGKRYQIIILIIGILLLIIAGTLWYKKRKQRLELEAQNSIRENKLITSQKVHDVVANGLYRIMSKLDHQETLKDDPIINEIEELYEQSRDISYEKPKTKNLPFNEKIANLLRSFASERTKVILVGNSAQLWEKASDRAKEEIEHILQELMVNMSKHSQANDVVIRFEHADEKINIYYTDNGIGISGKPQAKNGLTNTGNRIKAINGTLTFDTNVEKGLKIKILFPVS